MKTIIFMLCVIGGTVWLSNESYADSADFVRTLEYTHRIDATQPRRSVVPLNRERSGVIPRAIRGGNPLQLLNPFAPLKYGTAEENVVLDPEEPGRGEGVKLLSFSF
jgi:hypothetical protein